MRSLESRFSPRSWDLFVQSPKPPTLCWQANELKEGCSIALDVVKDLSCDEGHASAIGRILTVELPRLFQEFGEEALEKIYGELHRYKGSSRSIQLVLRAIFEEWDLVPRGGVILGKLREVQDLVDSCHGVVNTDKLIVELLGLIGLAAAQDFSRVSTLQKGLLGLLPGPVEPLLDVVGELFDSLPGVKEYIQRRTHALSRFLPSVLKTFRTPRFLAALPAFALTDTDTSLLGSKVWRLAKASLTNVSKEKKTRELSRSARVLKDLKRRPQ